MGWLYDIFGFDPFGENRRREAKEFKEYCNKLEESNKRITEILCEEIDLSSPHSAHQIEMQIFRFEREINRMKSINP